PGAGSAGHRADAHLSAHADQSAAGRAWRRAGGRAGRTGLGQRGDDDRRTDRAYGGARRSHRSVPRHEVRQDAGVAGAGILRRAAAEAQLGRTHGDQARDLEMIRHLRIRDFILIDELELELDEGFYALTGETGAGKSVLARAVELLRGGRA